RDVPGISLLSLMRVTIVLGKPHTQLPCIRKLGIDLQHLLEICCRLCLLTLHTIGDPARLVEECIMRVEADRLVVVGQCSRQVALLPPHKSTIIIGYSHRWLEADRFI